MMLDKQLFPALESLFTRLESEGRAERLVVVSKFRPDCDPVFISHVHEVFSEYRVKHIRQSEVQDFANAVEAEAHA